MPIEVAIKDAYSTIGEGPHWDDTTQTLYFVDIFANSVHRWNSLTNEKQKIVLDDTIGFVVPCKKGGVVIGLGRTFSHLDWETEKVTVIQEVDQGMETQLNDGKCDPRGRIWAGTMGKAPSLSLIPKGMGSLYCLYTNGTISKQVENVTISNGLAWSDDNKIMYYIDSVPGIVFAFNYDVENGTIGNPRTVVEFESGPFGTPFPDGMTIDTEGMLWVACFFGGCVERYDPKTGQKIGCIEMPVLRPTSCCFGGKNFDHLYVTCSILSCSEDELTKFPLTGSVFRVSGLGVKGCAAYIYDD